MGVRLVAALVAVVGIVNLLTAVHPRAHLSRLALPLEGAALGRTQTFVIGAFLIATARGLVTGRFAAWIGAVSVLGLAGLVAVRHRPFAVMLCGTALVLLIALKACFETRPDPSRLRQAGQVALVAIGAALIGGGWDAVANRHTPGGAGRVVIDDFSRGAPESWRELIITITIAGALVLAVFMALAPAGPPDPGDGVERAEVQTLVAHADADSLAPFATRADKSYVFSPDRRAAIGYRVLFGTAMAGGDPVGAISSAPEAMAAFLRLCVQKGWRPGVLGASDEMSRLWRAAGLHGGLVVGEEAVLDVDQFSLSSRRMRNLRQAVNRTRNAGVKVTVGELTPTEAEALRPILADWLGGSHERGFAMNLDKILTPRPGTLVAIAYASTGEPMAFARFGVAAEGRVITLDVAPRGHNASNGVAERLIVEMVGYAKAHGAREVSLNFAAMRWILEKDGVMPSAGAFMLRAFDRWIEIASLNRFCAKFDPQWRARSLLMQSWSQFGWVVAGAVGAEFTPARIPAQATPETADHDLPVDVCAAHRSK
jgi:lysylphosphatidylglycerol synthetase-like protein (DUF2156 family)